MAQVYRGATVAKKCDWSDNYGAILKNLGDEFANETIKKVEISSNERLVVLTHVVPLDAPVTLLESYGCCYVSSTTAS